MNGFGTSRIESRQERPINILLEADVTDRYQEMMDEVSRFADERDWDRFHTAKNLALALASEVGELAGELRWVEDDDAVDRDAAASELAALSGP